MDLGQLPDELLTTCVGASFTTHDSCFQIIECGNSTCLATCSTNLRTGFVLEFHWEERGILKPGEKGPLRIGGIVQRTVRIRCLNLRQRPFLDCKSDRAGKTHVFATLSN
jgi:hypothetical protein